MEEEDRMANEAQVLGGCKDTAMTQEEGDQDKAGTEHRVLST